jgi:hypothetical protein
MAVAADALLVTHRLGHRLAQRDAHVFDRVVAVDVQVAFGLDVQVDQPVAGDLVQHVVEKTDAGGQPGLAGAVKVDADGDLGLGGVAGDFGGARGGGHREAFSAPAAARSPRGCRRSGAGSCPATGAF